MWRRRKEGFLRKQKFRCAEGGRKGGKFNFHWTHRGQRQDRCWQGFELSSTTGCSPCTIAAMYTSVYTYKYGRGLHAACPSWIPWAYNFHAHTPENTRQQRRIHIPLGMDMDTPCVAWFLLDRESFTSLDYYIYRDDSLSWWFIRGVHAWISCGGGEEIFFLLVWRMTMIFQVEE